MKIKLRFVLMTLTAVMVSLFQETIAQNTSPYWSLVGNSNATAASKLGTTNAISLRFFTNNSLRMVILSNGNVGFGTSAPAYKLHVTIGSGTAVYGNGTTGVSGNGTTYGVYGNSASNYGVYGNSGYIGVYGTGTSYGVYGYSASGYGVTGTSGYLGVYGSGTTYGLYGSGGTYGLYSSGSSYGAYGTSSSGVGVYGNSSSNYGVQGNSGSSYAVYGNGYIGTYGEGSYVGAWGNGASYGLVGYGGPYGVWATGTSYAGYFQGNVYCSGTYSGSDRALKQNIKEFTSAMDIINKLKPRQYEYRHDGNYSQMNLPEGNHFGLIAQDVEEVLPNLVKDTKFETNMKRPVANGNPSSATADAAVKSETINFKAVNYTELIPVILKGMQEQNILIKQQQLQIDELKNAISALTGKQNVSGVLTKEDAYLKQNSPNPFNGNTTIQFSVPASAKKAQLLVYAENGSLLKSFSLGTGQSQVRLDKGVLASGNYVYTLMVDGQKVDSKNMTLIK